jgi:hypothetical protein
MIKWMIKGHPIRESMPRQATGVVTVQDRVAAPRPG